jgi:hypothetical protein
VEKVEFSEEETGLLLKGKFLDLLPALTLEKLKILDLADADSLDNLPRNLRVFLESTSTAVAWQPKSVEN